MVVNKRDAIYGPMQAATLVSILYIVGLDSLIHSIARYGIFPAVSTRETKQLQYGTVSLSSDDKVTRMDG